MPCQKVSGLLAFKSNNYYYLIHETTRPMETNNKRGFRPISRPVPTLHR